MLGKAATQKIFSGFAPVRHDHASTSGLLLTLPNGLVVEGIERDNLSIVDATVMAHYLRPDNNIRVIYLDGFSGTLQSDGYANYNKVSRYNKLIHIGCCNRTRRKEILLPWNMTL